MSGSSEWSWPPKTIVVGVDFGDASARALSLAAVLASEFKARITAIHAERFEPPPYFTLEQMKRLQEDRHAAQMAAMEHLESFARQAGAADVQPMVRDEAPVDAILDASHGADLVVVGTHGRRGPGRWWLGSVAERVVRGVMVPVLVTRASEDPVREVFRRVTLVGENANAADARSLAEGMTRIGGGTVTDGGSFAACTADVVRAASLAVVVRGPDGSGIIPGTALRALMSCNAPVLFVPGGGPSGRHVELEVENVR